MGIKKIKKFEITDPVIGAVRVHKSLQILFTIYAIFHELSKKFGAPEVR